MKRIRQAAGAMLEGRGRWRRELVPTRLPSGQEGSTETRRGGKGRRERERRETEAEQSEMSKTAPHLEKKTYDCGGTK